MNDEQTYLDQLQDPNPGKRLLAALRLGDSFNDEAAEQLFDLLLTERHPQVIWVTCHSLVPKWMVWLERKLNRSEEWLFGELGTATIIDRLRGWKYPSVESHIDKMFESEDWGTKLAAVNYCHNVGVFTTRAREVCLEYLHQEPGLPPMSRHLYRALGVENNEELVKRVAEVWRDFGPCDPA